MDDSPNHNASSSRAQAVVVRQEMGLEAEHQSSPTLTGSGSRPMDILPTMKEPLTAAMKESAQPINAQSLCINGIDISKVKKKLEYGNDHDIFATDQKCTDSVNLADRKGKGLAINELNGFNFTPSHGEQKPPEVTQFTGSNKDSISGSSIFKPKAGFLLLI